MERLKNVIYAIGGENARCQSNTVEMFDLIEGKEWQYSVSLPHTLSAAPAVTYDDGIFLYGGYSGSDINQNILMFREKEWKTVGISRTKRAFSTACICNGMHYKKTFSNLSKNTFISS